MSLYDSLNRWSTSDCGGSACENRLNVENTKSAKTHGYMFGTAVLVFVPLGVVSEAPGPRGFLVLTVGRQFSSHSKKLVT